MKFIMLLTLFATGLFAADATGVWKGSFKPENGATDTAHLSLKQTGSTVTGTAGPSEEKQHPIANGKAENGTITFEIPMDESTMRFTLKQEGEEITGEMTRQRDGQTEKAKLAVKRVK